MTATNNIGQKYNGPEYWYQNYWSGLVYSLPVRVFALDPVDPEFKSPGGMPLSKALSYSLLQAAQLQMSTSLGGVTTPKSLHVIETRISSCRIPH